MTHVCFSVAENCQNFYDSYGEICVHCNCCGRIDPNTKLQCQLELNKRLLEEEQEFNGWSDCPEVNDLQHKNVADNIEYFKRKIKGIEEAISEATEEVKHG